MYHSVLDKYWTRSHEKEWEGEGRMASTRLTITDIHEKIGLYDSYSMIYDYILVNNVLVRIA